VGKEIRYLQTPDFLNKTKPHNISEEHRFLKSIYKKKDYHSPCGAESSFI